MQALSGRWFSIAASGSYDERWTADVSEGCDPGTDPEFFKGAASQEITFASPRPVRVYGFEAVTPTLRDGPQPYLLFRSHYVRPGTKLARDAFGWGAEVRAPAVFRRSLTGTYRGCSIGPGYPAKTGTLPPISCPTLASPGFRVSVGWDPTTRGYPNIIDARGFPPETNIWRGCPDASDDLPALASQRGLPNWETDVSNALARPDLGRFLTAHTGATFVLSKLMHPVAVPYRFPGVQHSEQEAFVVRIRVLR
jgi:hypothetical protein